MDQDLVLRAQQGDKGAFAALTVTDYPRLFRVAHSILGEHSPSRGSADTASARAKGHIRASRAKW